jgi:hypothetical protein
MNKLADEARLRNDRQIATHPNMGSTDFHIIAVEVKA